MSQVIAADIGGTNVRMAVIDADGSILTEHREQAELSLIQAASTEAMEEAVITILTRAMQPFIQQHGCSKLGIGFPGFFRGDSGILAASPNLPALNEFPLSQLLSKALNIQVAAQNDALCAAIGEHHFGAGQGCDNLLHITLGTGVGGGLILAGIPYTGESGMAMEFGHLIIEPNSKRLCGCGNYGCVETMASATAVSSQYLQRSGKRLEAKAIFASAQAGDTDAIRVLKQAGHGLGQAIAEAVKLLDISRVTISGGLTGAWPLLHPAIIEAMEARLIAPQRSRITVMKSTLEDQAGLLGAAWIANQVDN